MFDTNTASTASEFYILAMKRLRASARQAITNHDYGHLIQVAYELEALSDLDNDFDYTDLYAQQWAYLASME